MQGFSRLLFHATQVSSCRGSVAGALEVGDETLAKLFLGGDGSPGEVQEPGACAILESRGEPVRHDLLSAVGRLDAQLVELEELRGVGGAIIARRQIQLKLTRPDEAP